MSELSIWHNPRCRKSRETLQLLEERGLPVKVIKYLETPPTIEKLHHVLELLDMEPRELMRKKESIYKDMNLGDATRSREELIAAMAEHPILIERPVVIRGNKAVLGRPPESVLTLVN